MAVITKLLKKNLANPDEVRNVGNGRIELAKFEDAVIGRIELQPGWSWEKDVQPLVQTRSCEVMHTQYCIQGRLMIRMDDGTELEIGPGDAVVVPPGHVGWVIGDEPFVAIDFTGSGSYGLMKEETEGDWDEIMTIE